MSPTPRKATKPSSRQSVVSWFKQYLDVNDQAKQEAERATELKDRLKDALVKIGEPDDIGHRWLDLPDVIEFKDYKGKVHQYATLKRERRLSPSNPTPDPEKAEALLRKKGLWLTEAQEKAIRDLQVALPTVVISVDVDTDAVASLYYKDVLTEDEYESVLIEQKETFAFIPTEL